MEIKDKLKQIAEGKGWTFLNARRDFLNLQDVAAFVDDTVEGFGVGETFLYLDPVKRDPSRDGSGIVYSGNFLVLTKSDIDDSYEGKFEKYISPLLPILLKEFPTALRCDYDVEGWSSVEVINLFDLNADGLHITFNLKSYE